MKPFVLCVVASIALGACEKPAMTPTAASTEIVIATAGPITGELAEFGAQMKHGVAKAVADINATGGVLGKQLRLEIGDDRCDPKRAQGVAKDLVSKHVVFVAGHFCSGSSIPASEVYQDAGVLQITPASSNPRLTDTASSAGWTTVFRVCGRDDRQGEFAGSWLAEHYRGKRVAIVHDGSAYGEGVAQIARRSMNERGLREVLFERISAGQRDFGDLVGLLKESMADAVYFGGYHPEGALIARQMRENGVTASMLGADAFNTSEFARLAGPAAEGVMFTGDADARKLVTARQVVDALRNDGFEPEGYTLNSYAAVQLWSQAVAKAGTTDAATVAQVLRSQSWNTVVGLLSFDVKGDRTSQPYVWYVFKSGRYVEAGV
jgi:branched-chain amino acid transport system substrate-binding protein